MRADRDYRSTPLPDSGDEALRCWHCRHKRSTHRGKVCGAAGCSCRRYLATRDVPIGKRDRPTTGRALGARRTRPRPPDRSPDVRQETDR